MHTRDPSQTGFWGAEGIAFLTQQLRLVGVPAPIRDAGHLAASGPQLSLKFPVVCERQRLGRFLVVQVAAANPFQGRGDSCVHRGPGSFIRGLWGQEKRVRTCQLSR